jgi:hypothetical protein
VHQQAVYACAHPEHGQPKHADEDRKLHPADALREYPDHRGGRTGVYNGEYDIGFAKLGVQQRTFDDHAWRQSSDTFLRYQFPRYQGPNRGHFSRSIHGN